MWYDANMMGHIVIPDQPGPDAGIMDWSRYLSELEKLPQDDEGVQVAIQGARDMIAEDGGHKEAIRFRDGRHRSSTFFSD